jgi:hypothetical protein
MIFPLYAKNGKFGVISKKLDQGILGAKLEYKILYTKTTEYVNHFNMHSFMEID